MRLRIAATAAAVAASAVVAVPLDVVEARHRGDATIDLPEGFMGEGVAVGFGNTFYAGSRADGRIARGDLRRKKAEVWVSEPVVSPAIGLDADRRHGLLWVSGGGSGRAAAYSLWSGRPRAELTLTTEPSFINDAISTRRGAYFTNSLAPELYHVPVSWWGGVGDPETLPLSGPAAEFVEGFNLNGIDATRDGKTLIVVNSAKGELYTVDARTGASKLIDLGGGSVRTGDGILLKGRTLYVLQNGAEPAGTPDVPNQIAVIRLRHDLSAGRIVKTLTSPKFETATTLDDRGKLLVAVNAQFAGAPIDPEAEVVLLRRR